MKNFLTTVLSVQETIDSHTVPLNTADFVYIGMSTVVSYCFPLNYSDENLATFPCFQVSVKANNNTNVFRIEYIKYWHKQKNVIGWISFYCINKIGLLLCHSHIKLRLRLRLSWGWYWGWGWNEIDMRLSRSLVEIELRLSWVGVEISWHWIEEEIGLS